MGTPNSGAQAQLVKEYTAKPHMPPPFSILERLWVGSTRRLRERRAKSKKERAKSSVADMAALKTRSDVASAAKAWAVVRTPGGGELVNVYIDSLP